MWNWNHRRLDPNTAAPRPANDTWNVAEAPLLVFLGCAHQMLDPRTSEARRRELEPRLLAQLPMLRALGMFELLAVRDPALRQLLEDEQGVRER